MVRTITAFCLLGLLCACTPLAARSSYSEQEVDDLIKENKDLRAELQKESKAAIEARNHAKNLFHELMRSR